MEKDTKTLIDLLKRSVDVMVSVCGEPPLYRDPVQAERAPTRYAAWKTIDDARAAIAKFEGA